MSKWSETYHFPKEVLEQADAIKNCIIALKDDLSNISTKYSEINNIHIVGSGDCYFISIAAAEAFEKLAAIRTNGYEAYDYYLRKPEITENTMVILFSSSGKSLYVLKSAEYAAKAGAVTIGVTNHADSPLGTMCTIPLITVATGVSKSFPTKTTTSALAILYQLAYEMGRKNGHVTDDAYLKLSNELVDEVPDMIRQVYTSELDRIRKTSQMFLDARSYTFVGSGPSRSTAIIGAAKIVETTRKHVTFCNAEEYMHLHGFAVRGSDVVVVIGNNISDHRESQVVDYARNQCARVLVVGDIAIENNKGDIVQIADFTKTLSPWGLTLVTMVALHLFACELAHKGYLDPDAPHEVDLKHIIDQLYTGPVAGWQV